MSNPTTVEAWLAMLERRHPRAIDLGLDRVAEVWQRMGEPRPAARLFMVGGTNGKGSTVAYVSGMLWALGYRCGNYTSPHLSSYNERVVIQGERVSDRELIDAFECVEAARGAVSLTYFEFGTLAAFYLLSRAALDFAVLEVGLGGRLDAVNILDADCAIITQVDLDHQEYLGNDVETIGYEKAGIMRPGIPVICGQTDPPRSAHPCLSACPTRNPLARGAGHATRPPPQQPHADYVPHQATRSGIGLMARAARPAWRISIHSPPNPVESALPAPMRRWRPPQLPC